MTADLVAFLNARLDEDEQVARSAAPGPWRVDPPPRRRVTDGEADATREHIARWDPARVLADVQAKRAILQNYAITARIRDEAAIRIREAGDSPTPADLDEWDRAEKEASVLVGAVLLLASVHAAHADYRPEWAPDV